MNILAIDTATLVSSVALLTEDKLLAEITLQTRLTHSEVLMPHIEQLLNMAGMSKQELDAVAVSIGPGSFTGLRIGLAAAKAMAYALDIEIIGVPTLAALACNYPVPGVYLAPLLDAQKGNAYMAVYEWRSQKLCEIKAPFVAEMAEVVQLAAKAERPVIFLGEMAAKHRERLAQTDNSLTALSSLIMPRAASVGIIALDMQRRGVRQDVMSLEPLYIRRSEAEVLWEQRNGVHTDEP